MGKHKRARHHRAERHEHTPAEEVKLTSDEIHNILQEATANRWNELEHHMVTVHDAAPTDANYFSQSIIFGGAVMTRLDAMLMGAALGSKKLVEDAASEIHHWIEDPDPEDSAFEIIQEALAIRLDAKRHNAAQFQAERGHYNPRDI